MVSMISIDLGISKSKSFFTLKKFQKAPRNTNFYSSFLLVVMIQFVRRTVTFHETDTKTIFMNGVQRNRPTIVGL